MWCAGTRGAVRGDVPMRGSKGVLGWVYGSQGCGPCSCACAQRFSWALGQVCVYIMGCVMMGCGGTVWGYRCSGSEARAGNTDISFLPPHCCLLVVDRWLEAGSETVEWVCADLALEELGAGPTGAQPQQPSAGQVLVQGKVVGGCKRAWGARGQQSNLNQ